MMAVTGSQSCVAAYVFSDRYMVKVLWMWDDWVEGYLDEGALELTLPDMTGMGGSSM